MPSPVTLPRVLAVELDARLTRLERACRAAGVPFHDDAGVDTHLARVLLASDFAYASFLRTPELLGQELVQLMGDPRYADARAGTLRATTSPAELRTALRRFREREALRLIWRDVNGLDDVETTLLGSSMLARVAIDVALAGAEREVAARHGIVRDASGRPQRLVVLGFGKLGGDELNFSSDVDLAFAYAEPGDSDGARPLAAEEYFARIGRALVALLADRDADGYVFRVDLRLRPYGNAGRIALSFAAMEQYYQREGRDWERYAWIKARPVAGDRVAGARLLELLRPFVYRRYLDYTAFAGLREMKALIDAEVARQDLAGNLKLGPGGIREIEFVVQLAQMIRGGREPTLRASGLLAALAACEQRGIIAAASARRLRESYRFLRRVENRVQMFADAQTHELPADPSARERIAWALDYPGVDALEADIARHRGVVAEEYAAALAPEPPRAESRSEVDWTLLWQQAGAGIVDAEALAKGGFADGAAAASALSKVLDSAGVRTFSARARGRFDRVMPRLLAVAARQSEPMTCLERMLQLVQAIARRSAYLALLDERPAALARVAGVFAASAFLAERVVAHPLLLDDLFDDRDVVDIPDRGAVTGEIDRRLGADPAVDTGIVLETVQEERQSARFRIGLAVLGGHIDAVAATRALTGVAEAALATVLATAARDLAAVHGVFPGRASALDGFAVIGYGSFGGESLGFDSDLDLVFVHDGTPADAESSGERPLDPARYYARLAQRVVHLLESRTRSGPLYEVDMRLRPDGSKGLLVTSLEAYAGYQRERAWTWEQQALVRARAIAGDPAVCRAFAKVRSGLLMRPRDQATVVTDLVSMRSRWRRERDRSDAGRIDLKQGLGGLVDIGFLLQGLVLLHAADHQGLCGSTNDGGLIGIASACGLLDPGQHGRLAEAHAHLLARALACTLDGRPRVVLRDAATAASAQAVVETARELGFDFTAIAG